MTHTERAQQLIADPLLELGNHGWAHRNVRGLSGRSLLDEIRGPEAAFQVQRLGLAASQCAAVALGRPPLRAEIDYGTQLLASSGGIDSWERYCLLLLCANEFMYVE